MLSESVNGKIIYHPGIFIRIDAVAVTPLNNIENKITTVRRP